MLNIWMQLCCSQSYCFPYFVNKSVTALDVQRRVTLLMLKLVVRLLALALNFNTS